MSTLKVDAIRHNSATSDAITMASDGTCTAKITSVGGGQLSHRNLVINGAMTISQRGASFAFDGYGIDRFWWGMFGRDQAVTTRTQSTDTPSGFKNSQKLVVNTAETSLDSGERAYIRHRIEGQDLQQLGTGASGAKKLTLSFYAKTASNNSGHQYSIYLSNNDISGNDRIQTRSFTVTSTWQRFTFTFDGQEDISIRNDNDYGLELFISLSAHSSYEASAITSWTNSTYKVVSGQSNFLASTSNEFYLTGVQLEVGDTATSFEHRSIGDELARCQRYYEETYVMTDAGNSYVRVPVLYKVEKRAAGTPVSYAKRPDGVGTGAANKAYQANGERDAVCNYSWTGGTMLFVTGYSNNYDTFGNIRVDAEL